MYRGRPVLRGVGAAAMVLLLHGCDGPRASPVEPGGPALGQAPFEPSLPPLPAFCAEDTYERTPDQVLEDHRAALAAGNLDAVRCNYAVDAVVISDGGIDVGQDEIRSSLAFFLQIFGGTQPQVVQQITVQVPDQGQQFPPAPVLAPVLDPPPPTHMVRLLFTFDTPCLSIPDGLDTYIIRSGQIHAQTSHAVPVFRCPP